MQPTPHHATIQAVADRIRNPKWSCIGVAGIMYGYIGYSIQFAGPLTTWHAQTNTKYTAVPFAQRPLAGPMFGEDIFYVPGAWRSAPVQFSISSEISPSLYVSIFLGLFQARGVPPRKMNGVSGGSGGELKVFTSLRIRNTLPRNGSVLGVLLIVCVGKPHKANSIS